MWIMKFKFVFILLNYFFSIILSVELPSRTLCNLNIPQTGEWQDKPPYWIPQYCENHKSFTYKEVQECFAGQKIYIIGDDFMRHMFYGLVEVFSSKSSETVTAVASDNKGENKPKRGLITAEEHGLCAKHQSQSNEYCKADVGGIQIKYLYMKYMNGFDYKGTNLILDFLTPFNYPFFCRCWWLSVLKET
jgi:hypothetical protein